MAPFSELGAVKNSTVKYLSILPTEIGKLLDNKPHRIVFRAISINIAGSAAFLQQIAVTPDTRYSC